MISKKPYNGISTKFSTVIEHIKIFAKNLFSGFNWFQISILQTRIQFCGNGYISKYTKVYKVKFGSIIKDKRSDSIFIKFLVITRCTCILQAGPYFTENLP